MPRKTLADVAILKSVSEDFEALSLVRYEMAKDAYEVQDDETKAAIDRVVGTLRQHANGTVKVKSGGTFYDLRISDQTFGFNLLYLAVEIVKDLLFGGVKLANFKVDPNVCASCGDKIERTRKRRRGATA